jgi:hypothetical protein
LSERGNAVLGGLLSITFATLITLSILGLGLSAMNTLMIRDASISAAARAALSEAPPQRQYLLRLLDTNLPQLATYEVGPLDQGGLVGFEVISRLPALGLWQPEMGRVIVFAAKERI